MAVIAFGLYERAVDSALRLLRAKPWMPLDLSRLRQVLDDRVLRELGIPASAAEITDWLAALHPEDRVDLVDRLNCAACTDLDPAGPPSQAEERSR